MNQNTAAVLPFPTDPGERRQRRHRRIAGRDALPYGASRDEAERLINAESEVILTGMKFLEWADATEDLTALPDSALRLLDDLTRLQRLYDGGV